MNGAEILDVARDGIWTLLKVAGPLMIVGLLVGVVIALFQALTQIQRGKGSMLYVLAKLINMLTEARKVGNSGWITYGITAAINRNGAIAPLCAGRHKRPYSAVRLLWGVAP